MLVLAGGDQSGIVGQELPNALQVRVVDSHGRPVFGQLVTFHVTAGGGSTFSGANITNYDGIAQERWTLGTNAREPQRLEARAVNNRNGAAITFAVFSATALPDVPASIRIESGDQQTAAVGHPLTDPCVVAVRDQYGNAVPSVPVDWTVETGGGLVSPATPTTDDDGHAAATWTLGDVEGEQMLGATAGGLSVSFHATAVALPSPATIAKIGGDGQSAPPGTALAIAPRVLVLDGGGAPVIGAEVSCAVTLGGGSIENATALTDAEGHASCGTWTLGPSKGLNLLRASVVTLEPVTFSASAANVSPEVTITTVITPMAGETVSGDLGVAAQVASTYQLATVTASVREASVELVYGYYRMMYGYAWSGTLSLAGQPRGPVGLVVTATDVYGHVTDAVVELVLDRPPVVTVSAPLDGSVARPRLDLAAACTDDDPAGCQSLVATVEGVQVATGTNTISKEIDLSAFEGRSVRVNVVGEDSIGQFTVVSRQVFVESSARLRVRDEVSGAVWDVAGSRVLFLDVLGGTPALKMLDDAAGTTQTVETGPDLLRTENNYGNNGYVTPTGAIYVHGCSLFEWRQGAISQLAGLAWCYSLHVSGGWAIYFDFSGWWRRDLEAGSSELVTNAYGDADVASNGDVAYSIEDSLGSNFNIHRWRSGTDVALTSDANPDLSNAFPVTDGINVVYRKYMLVDGTFRIAMHDGATETVLTAATASAPSYAVAGGYVAYSKEGQMWRHGPTGEEQVAFFGGSSAIDAIGPDGTILFVNSATGKRYRAVPGSPLEEIGSTLGRVVYRDGEFLVILGRDVLEVVP